ncbi:hypothetical protein GT044_40235 [Streptomyces sp. SID335]|uniref:Uncharacterized protein n=1 Tax=Streptomyces venezuelae TaxID=54571 RepID=A0A5P2B5K3_STRVZ|nr:hypothetical protein [Streptomyces sp. SID335]MYY87398.1 hypothetical protein [Streptomyces sp. SID335]QES25556.1 hypothetical protein DEJ47_02975 [Streptomyces venezuelae]
MSTGGADDAAGEGADEGDGGDVPVPPSSGHCHEIGSSPGPGGSGSGVPSSIRLYALVSATAPAASAEHASASRPPGAAPGGDTGGGGGRAALNSLCRWRI